MNATLDMLIRDAWSRLQDQIQPVVTDRNAAYMERIRQAVSHELARFHQLGSDEAYDNVNRINLRNVYGGEAARRYADKKARLPVVPTFATPD